MTAEAKMATWTLIGAGRIGGTLQARAAERQRPVQVLGRHDDWRVLEQSPGTPIVVCTRNDDLADVLMRVPAYRKRDLVFVQNGMLRPWLAQHDLADATRGLLFFAVQSRGAPLTPGPPSPFCGPHAAAVVAELQALDVPAEVVAAPQFAAWELEKLLWNCVFGLLCQAHDCMVGDVLTEHRDELAALVNELLPVAEQGMAVRTDAKAVLRRLVDYSAAIPRNRAAVKEWPWRNGWFVAEAERQGVELPIHRRLCRLADVEHRLADA
jgi:ketopantoate reductase